MSHDDLKKITRFFGYSAAISTAAYFFLKSKVDDELKPIDGLDININPERLLSGNIDKIKHLTPSQKEQLKEAGRRVMGRLMK